MVDLPTTEIIEPNFHDKVEILRKTVGSGIDRYLLIESSIMKLATSPCLKIFVLLSFSKPVISFDNRLETVRLSSQG